MKWNRTLKHFGEVKEGETAMFIFRYLGNKKYKTHRNSCDCKGMKSEWVNNELRVAITFDPVPKQNKVGYYKMMKFVTVSFEDTNEILSIEAVVFKSLI